MQKRYQLVKSLASVIIPSFLFAILVFQTYNCRSKLILRNSYLLESLPQHSDWVWDALSGDHNSHETSDNGVPVSDDANNNDQRYHRAVLLPGIPTLTVHYLWCIDGYFELGHYLVILSIVHQLQPDQIIIHYREEPRTDPQGYWRWLDDLQRNVIMLSMRPLANPQICRHELSAGVVHDQYDFPDPYGVFLLGDVVINNLTRSHVMDLMISSFSQRKSTAYTQTLPLVTENELRKSQLFLVSDIEPYHLSQSPGRVVISCPSVTTVNRFKQFVGVSCINIDSYISPEELLKRNNNFYQFARSLMYGTADVVNVHMSPTIQIPNIVHIILLDGVQEISPLLYVSIKSAYSRGKVDDVFVHGSTPPTGELWDRLLARDELKVNYIPTPSSEQLNTKHAGMVYALYILLLHGGVAHFGDVICLSPIASLSRRAGALATFHYSEYRLKHQSINTAILAGSVGSTFIESMLARLRQEDLKWPGARADDVATHVREINPESLFLDSKLTSHQNCNEGRCQLAGAHNHPKQAYTTRLIWSGDSPHTLDQLKYVEGPTKNDIQEIIEISHFMHSLNTS